MSDMTSTLYDPFLRPGLTNLKMGAPDEATLKKCVRIFREAAEHRLAQADAQLLFQYGPEAGDGCFRVALAKFLSDEYRSPVKPENLFVTSGSTNGLLLLASLMFRSGDLVFCEDPTYFMAISILRADAGLDLVSVPTDDHGIIPEELEKCLQASHTHKSHPITPKRPFWAMLYLIPAFQNPTGSVLGRDRFQKIISLARQYNILVVCDDVYNLLYFAGMGAGPQDRLFAFDDPKDAGYQGNVVSNGSFSKIFGPGVRLGWLEVPAHVRDTLITSGVAFSGGGQNHTSSGLMTSAISLGLLGGLLAETRRSNETKCMEACGILRNKYPGLLSFQDPTGGYFIWIKLPNGLKAADVLKLCEEAEGLKVSFFCGNALSPTKSFEDHIRISFAFYDVSALVPAIHKLADIIHLTCTPPV
ncbi:hypothetical protein EMCRGX_G034035 [Ephydatia muelleri]